MALIQAYRRTKTYTHAFPDMTLVFQPNDKGDVVCDVQDQDAVDLLLQTPTGFRLYGEQADAPISMVLTDKSDSKVEELPLNDHPYVLKNEKGESVLDLRPLSDDELRAFADANNIKVHPNCKGDTIRDKIVEFLTAEE